MLLVGLNLFNRYKP